MRSTPRILGIATAAVIALAALLPQAAGAATAPSAQTQANRALAKVAADTRKLPKKAVSARNRKALLSLLNAARKSSRKSPCRSITALRAYRKAIRSRVKEKRVKGRYAGAPRYRGKLDADALAANVALLTLPRARKCGGGKVSTVATTTPTVLKSDERQLTMKVQLPAPTFVARKAGGTEFQQMFMDGMGESGDVGKPGMPQTTKFFGVPLGADVKVTVGQTEGYDLHDVNLYPHQPNSVDLALPPGAPPASTFADKPFTLDANTYNKKAPFPASPADGAALGSMRGLQIGGVDFSGGQYNPKTDTLHVFTSIDVTIDFGGGNEGNFGDPDTFTNPWNAHFFKTYQGFVVNSRAILDHLGQLNPRPFCGEEMLIVTSPALQPAANTFATARNAAGFSTRVALVGPDPGQIGTTATQIQTFIRNELNRKDCYIHPSYVVLFGNTANVPTFDIPCVPTPTTCDVATDLPYSTDGIGTDLFADVMLGRIPAADIDAANAVVTKIVNYETTMPAPAGDDFYSHATVTGYFQPASICVLNVGETGTPNCDGDHPPVTGHWEIDYSNHQDTRGFTKTAEAIKQAMDLNGYNVDRLFTTDDSSVIPETYYDGTPIPSFLRRPAFAWDASTTDFLNAYNGGRFLILHRDHGWPDGWAEPTLHSGHVPAMTNGTKLPVVFGVNCASAAFDDPTHPSFVELQVMKPDGGAFAGFGDSRVSPSFPNNHMALGFFDALFPNTEPTFGSPTPSRRLGDVLLSGKAFMASQEGIDWQGAGDTYYEHHLYGLLGDPSAQMWAAEPHPWDPSKITSTYVARADGPPWEIHVQLPPGGGDPPPEGTILTLLQNGQAIGKAIAGADGTATLTPEVNVDPTNLKVALDQDGALPAQDDVDGTPPQKPQKATTTMTITCPSAGKVQGTSAVQGDLTGAPAGVTVHVKWSPPQGQPAFTHDVTTDASGHWVDRTGTNFAGQWSVDATYDGDDTHLGSTANCGFAVS